MASEFKHKDPGTALTQCEYISTSGCGHIFACQATGDILYADSSTILKRLARGSASQVLQIASCKPAWTSTPSIGSTSWANANHAHDASNSGGTITSFSCIDNGTSNITTGGTTTIDVDATGTDGTDLSAAGTLRFGASQDLRIFHGGAHNYITGVTGDLVITTDGGSAAGIILDTEDDTFVIKYSGTIGASFGTGGLCIVSGDVYSIAGSQVLSGSVLASAVKLNNGNWSGTDLTVANGGTGLSCLTTGSVLIGTGSSDITLVDMATKGDILIGDGTTAPRVLDVSVTNDHVLTVASGETTGVKWAAIPSQTTAISKLIVYGGP
jgi:hypothetical protein